MKLNENLQICLLALASRCPNSTMDINEEALGFQSDKTEGYTPSDLIKLLQHTHPQVLHASARLVVDAQEKSIYLVEHSQETPAVRPHCRERTPEEEITFLCTENAALQAENRKLKAQLTQGLLD